MCLCALSTFGANLEQNTQQVEEPFILQKSVEITHTVHLAEQKKTGVLIDSLAMLF